MPDDVSQSPADGVTVAWLLAALLRARKTIYLFALIGLVLSAVLALLKEKTFTSSFTFLPKGAEDQGRSGLASLAGQLGISVGGLGGAGQPPQLYADLVETRAVLEPIARDSVLVDNTNRRVPVMELLEVKQDEPSLMLATAIKKLKADVVSTSVATHTTGVITVNATAPSPRAAYELAQKLLAGINHFNIVTRTTQASQERKFIEGRLEATKTSLLAAENALQGFLQTNRQYAGSPELSFQKERLQREVSLQQQIVVGLSQQYEDARIREVRDTPVITVIDQPQIPAMKDSQGRAVLVIAVTFIFTFLGILLVIAKAVWSRASETHSDPSHEVLASEWRRFRHAKGSEG